ncbi:MAG: hypothetical protein HYV09_31570 [Deltaproteobacteria bacterium]|nr:hypothetical protein [Deltaproteobacteria bacterium]
MTLGRRAMLLSLVVAATPVVACRSDEGRAIDPVWGKQPCAHCAMLVSERRAAAQLVDQSGERQYFDDIGCMAAWAREHAEPKRMWVRAPNDDGWVDARTARYRTDAKTPMDYGFVAANEGVGWDDVRARAAARDVVKGP